MRPSASAPSVSADEVDTAPVSLDEMQLRQLEDLAQEADARNESERQAYITRLEELLDAIEMGGEVALHALRELYSDHAETYVDRRAVRVIVRGRLVNSQCRFPHKSPTRHTTQR